MPVDCQRSTSGGKGNFGMFIERDHKICAAGLPTSQPDERVGDSLSHYLLKDSVDALISDAIIPSPKPRPLPPLRHPLPTDKRNAGPYGQVAELINPTDKTKFQCLVDDLKETAYTSYWKKPLGIVQDSVPMLPEGFNINDTTFGRKTPFHGSLYDIVMPKNILLDKTPIAKMPGVQTQRNYCAPPFDANLTYGYRTNVDKRGRLAKCCVTDDRIVLGTANRCINNSIQANFAENNKPQIGLVLAPNNNIKEVPDGYSFGILKPPDNLPECLTTCEINPDKYFYRKCLAHLNSLRKYMSKRFIPTFFASFYLNLKYYDNEKSGWLSKDIAYELCGTKHIRFDPSLIEPILSLWQSFDGSKLKYKTLVQILNFTQPTPDLPKIIDLPSDCLDFRTTYTDMVKPDQPPNTSPMAGLPSGRYFDMDYPVTPSLCCKAIDTLLPQETDMKSCLSPSVMTLLNVNHRDMYAKRDEATVRKVFEAVEGKFTDEKFNDIWEKAKKYHSQGWVSFETFKRALET